MGKMLEAMLGLQMIERQLAEVRRQLSSKSGAVRSQQKRIDDLHGQLESLKQDILAQQREYGAVELELKRREEEVAKFRLALNTTKTNKEYAAALTQLNTLKADNSKLEDNALRSMQAVDQIRTQAEELARRIEQAEQSFEQVKRTSAEESAGLEGILADLIEKRSLAASAVPEGSLSVFDRIASTRDGEVMARIEILGKKPPHQYVCGGCNMSITAEHANALRTRDEIRFCDCCGRILYLREQEPAQRT